MIEVVNIINENFFLIFEAFAMFQEEASIFLLSCMGTHNVIKTSNVQQLEFKGQKIVIELFQAINSDPKQLLHEKNKSLLEKAEKQYNQENHQIFRYHWARIYCRNDG